MVKLHLTLWKLSADENCQQALKGLAVWVGFLLAVAVCFVWAGTACLLELFALQMSPGLASPALCRIRELLTALRGICNVGHFV